MWFVRKGGLRQLSSLCWKKTHRTLVYVSTHPNHSIASNTVQWFCQIYEACVVVLKRSLWWTRVENQAFSQWVYQFIAKIPESKSYISAISIHAFSLSLELLLPYSSSFLSPKHDLPLLCSINLCSSNYFTLNTSYKYRLLIRSTVFDREYTARCMQRVSTAWPAPKTQIRFIRI